MVVLNIEKSGQVAEEAVICWTSTCERAILPRRKPNRQRDGATGWLIQKDKRRLFGKHVLKCIEGINRVSNGSYGGEENSCYFALVGIGRRWADCDDVEWWIERK